MQQKYSRSDPHNTSLQCGFADTCSIRERTHCREQGARTKTTPRWGRWGAGGSLSTVWGAASPDYQPECSATWTITAKQLPLAKFKRELCFLSVVFPFILWKIKSWGKPKNSTDTKKKKGKKTASQLSAELLGRNLQPATCFPQGLVHGKGKCTLHP